MENMDKENRPPEPVRGRIRGEPCPYMQLEEVELVVVPHDEVGVAFGAARISRKSDIALNLYSELLVPARLQVHHVEMVVREHQHELLLVEKVDQLGHTRQC